MSVQSVESAKKAECKIDKNARTVFKMRAQMLEQGRTQETLAKTDNMALHLKVYASGGENGLHTHPNEDHVFIIMQGTARYYDADGGYIDVGKHEGILLPAGAYYWFEAIGEEPLVLMRVGSKVGSGEITTRLNIQGEPVAGNSEENKRVPVVAREGVFFE
jgi:mannose-6-phosphate isomerase-like protein (cupin superfamily)